jgi:hypothetical protein
MSRSLGGRFPKCCGGEDENYKAESASKLLHVVRIASAFASDVN